ncbi:hypothetical protein KsCSTR_21890 [Candidatus Kuenenia stuttgartiensis]|jgi:hypothetical protein|nr:MULTISPECIES: hypothetical protein [Kuenenia]MBE7547017.1 hypothetical protein [Planctomycetia bacterium]MBZ0192740.1 hypothetical protein [Candidatus Kuenenia stuttgartiensis]MCF6151353.1 hypothetical protein [Candidatus Kuenenia stuttgartiensis]MCL4728182.1 hypothetical protein [Candidatus Kuenenia stuttgartiensis]MCZ7623052.1 hypothetical protein [Candidatus Kuenenia sp.]
MSYQTRFLKNEFEERMPMLITTISHLSEYPLIMKDKAAIEKRAEGRECKQVSHPLNPHFSAVIFVR